MTAVSRHTEHVKQLARDLQFSFCGIAEATFLEEEAPRLETWLKRGYQGKMSYLEKHFDKRLDPRLLVPGAKSIVSLGYNYFPPQDLAQPGTLKISKYAYREDYHHVIKEKLVVFMDRLSADIGPIEGRVFVDSAPVHERAWAKRAGNGWVGKNSLLLNRQLGSFFFLAELILDVELTPDGPIADYCGTCTACQDACPTNAIAEPYVVDGSKCISYLTIELKEAIPTEFKGKMEEWVFGCDICQDVCPWNRFAQPHREKKFLPSAELENLMESNWEDLTEEVFRKVFRDSAVQRTKWQGLTRNIQFARESEA
jgi:epoxyqueuosine reductase